jgi:hypothetical protein
VVALGFRDAVLADLVEQRLVADLQQYRGLLRFQLVSSRALAMASASASSFALRDSDFKPPEDSDPFRGVGLKGAPPPSFFGVSS